MATALKNDDVKNPTFTDQNQHISPIIEETMKFWSERTGKPMSAEDARQSIENLSGYFQILYEWAQAEKPEAC